MVATTEPTEPKTVQPKRRQRIFMWTFLAIQALFIGLIVLYATESTGPSHATVLSGPSDGSDTSEAS